MWEDLFRSCGTYPGMSEGPMWVRLGRKEGAVMGNVTEVLTGSEAPGRGSNQDHNLGISPFLSQIPQEDEGEKATVPEVEVYRFPCPREPKHTEWYSSSPFPADHVLELCSSDTHTCSHGNISDIRIHLTTDGI